jgi:adenylate cyclase
MSEGGVQRRLAAVLAIDIAGYTRLVESNRDGTVTAWKASRTNVIDPAVSQHSGRIVKLTGDGCLAEFQSAQDAVQCALDMQAALAASPLDFRMGVGLGDIIDDGEDIHGEGVNIAARIEALAVPGGVWVAGMVHEAVHHQMDALFTDMGEHTVKNVTHPVRVYSVSTGEPSAEPDTPPRKIPKQLIVASLAFLVVVGGALGWFLARPDFKPVEPSTMALKLPDRPSIAVLPFDYFGEGKAENEYIADGLSEQITSVLADVPELFVIARNSSFTYKGKAVDVREVSKKFGVRYVLEGSVQKSGGKLRVTAQLIDAVEGKHIWAETFDRNYADLFKIQDEITVAVAQKIHLGAIRGNELANRPTNSLEAWSENVKGLEQLRLYTAEGYKKALQHFARAIELDPQYVNPHHLMAFAHTNEVRFGYSSDPAKSFTHAEQFLSRALALEPGNAEALAGTAFLRYVQKNIPEAKRLALEAHEKAPNQPYVAFALAWILLYSGDPEGAIGYYTLIKRLAPVPSVAILNGDLLAYIYAGNYEKAKKLAPVYLERVSNVLRPVNLVFSALPFYKTNDLATAKSMVKEALKLQPDLSIQSFRHFDLPFADQSVPESFYTIYRELGVPDLPPGKRADPAKIR